MNLFDLSFVRIYQRGAQAVEFAYMMSKQLGRKTVRLVDCNLWGSTDHESFQEFVGAMSGTYIQSK